MHGTLRGRLDELMREASRREGSRGTSKESELNQRTLCLLTSAAFLLAGPVGAQQYDTVPIADASMQFDGIGPGIRTLRVEAGMFQDL